MYPFYDSDLDTTVAVASEPVQGERRCFFKKYQLYRGPSLKERPPLKEVLAIAV